MQLGLENCAGVLDCFLLFVLGNCVDDFVKASGKLAVFESCWERKTLEMFLSTPRNRLCSAFFHYIQIYLGNYMEKYFCLKCGSAIRMFASVIKVSCFFQVPLYIMKKNLIPLTFNLKLQLLKAA